MRISTLLFKSIFILVCVLFFHTGYGQDTLKHTKTEVYKLRPSVDVPLVIGCAAWCAYAGTQIYSKGNSTQAQILALNSNQIDPLDRWAIRPYNHNVDRGSYYPFYAAFPLPLVVFLFGKNTRSDFMKLTFLYLEALSVTGLSGTSATYFVNQYRPYAYSASTDINEKMTQNAKNSFYAGHVEIMAVSTFFAAKVCADYHPHSKVKWLFYTLAGAATAGMGYLRIDAGMHFPSDVLLGATTGAFAGILVPYFHSHRMVKNSSHSLSFN